MKINFTLFVLTLLVARSCQISEKGKKLAESVDDGNALGSEQDIFADEDFDMGFSLDDFGDDDDFGGDDDEESGSSGSFFDRKPKCDEENDNSTICSEEEMEPRVSDVLLEQLMAQIWADAQHQLQQDEQFDPLDIDARLPEPIDLDQEGSGYQARVRMSDMRLFGLSRIRLDRASVTRSANLTDLALDVGFAFDSLLINGSYSLQGSFGWWDLDSQGMQPFSMAMTNATFSYKMYMKMADGFDSPFNCGPEGSVQISEIRLPLEYEDINFDFRNLGDFANTVVNGVGVYVLQTQEETMVAQLRKAIKDKFNSLIC